MTPEFQAMASGIRMADSVQVFEGLPREGYEKARASEAVVELHGWGFYERTLPMDADDLAKIRAACSDPASFRMPCSDTKLCVGFHPDYQFSWKQGNRRFDVQLCTGCLEAKMFFDDTLAIHADLDSASFVPLLEHYRAAWPARVPSGR